MDIGARSSRRWIRQLGQFGAESRRFAQILGGHHRSARLFIVGTEGAEPWHFTAHLAEQAERCGRSDLAPTLLRWKVPSGAPRHLAVGMESLTQVNRSETVLVVSPYGESGDLLNRVDDARRQGARILAIHRECSELLELSHDGLSVGSLASRHEIEVGQHLVTDLAPLQAQADGPVAPAFRRAV
jgi:hypothetical protein